MDALTEAMEYEAGAVYGDPRRCARHGLATSSPDGLFDAPCPACEEEYDLADAMGDEATEDDVRAVLAARAARPAAADDCSDDIPF